MKIKKLTESEKIALMIVNQFRKTINGIDTFTEKIHGSSARGLSKKNLIRIMRGGWTLTDFGKDYLINVVGLDPKDIK